VVTTIFKAAILRKTGQPLSIENLIVPKIQFGQVLIQVFYSGICRSQLMEVSGQRGVDNFLPHLLGHEGVGRVLEVGQGVTKVKSGDDVIIGWIKGNGINANNPMYISENGSKINAGAVTTFSELTIVSENRVYLKPDDLEQEISVLFGCSFLTGAGLVFNEITPKKTDTILILGLGGVGLAALISSAQVNPDKIIVADKSSNKRLIAKELGAKVVLDSNKYDFIDQVKRVSNGGVNIAYECAGSTESIEIAFECIKEREGRLIFASHPSSGQKIKLDPFELIKGKSIQGSWGGNSSPDRDIPRFTEIMKNQLSHLHKLVGKKYSLEDINIAIEDLENGETTRPLIDMKL
jgi:S-(hydroxymethyl)glutathione dehydrogenase/alcohol dehydrogenase